GPIYSNNNFNKNLIIVIAVIALFIFVMLPKMGPVENIPINIPATTPATDSVQPQSVPEIICQDKVIGEEFALFDAEGNRLKEPIFETTGNWGENGEITNTNDKVVEIILKAKLQVGCNNADTRYSLNFREYPLTLQPLSAEEIKINTEVYGCNVGGLVGQLLTGEYEIKYVESQGNKMQAVPITETVCE
ncbi:MAG: hypothetical protein ABIH20_07050, partial [Candidatus Diapherotrites archaeon]